MLTEFIQLTFYSITIELLLQLNHINTYYGDIMHLQDCCNMTALIRINKELRDMVMDPPLLCNGGTFSLFFHYYSRAIKHNSFLF